MTDNIKLPNKKYNIIYADPPWNYPRKQYQSDNRKMTSINDFYKTISNEEMCKLPINTITDNDCILFLWVTDSHLEVGIDVIKSWGFSYRTIGFTWVKQYKNNSICVNVAPYTLKSTEICLIGLKGKLKNIKKSNKVKNLVFAERTKHSKKPNEVRNRIEEFCYDLPKIELFARQKYEGWDAWGDEV